ncbi:MAG TPA: NAD-dependent epimerase/dehydratase family protein [Chloroflexota bacterium]
MAARSVLVVGGTGFLGQRIAETLRDAGCQVTLLTRGQRPTADFELVAVDRHDADGLRAALGRRSFDVVVDNIAFTGEEVERLLEALRGRIGHYIQTSSAAVYADRYTRRPLRETDADLTARLPADGPNPFHPRLGHAYGNGKREAEQALLQAGVDWTALRPPIILASDDRTRRVWWFVQRLLDGQPVLIPDWGPGRVFQVAWTHDVARAVACAAGNPAAFGHAYNVAQAEIYTAESWIEACAAVLNVRPRYAHVAEDCPPGYRLPVAGRPFGHILLDCGAIRAELGFEPSPESVWLAETIGGCAARPPREPSAGYESRAEEVRLARTAAR